MNRALEDKKPSFLILIIALLVWMLVPDSDLYVIILFLVAITLPIMQELGSIHAKLDRLNRKK